MSAPPVILWFRRDLRLHDNPALNAAHESGAAILPVFILDTAHDWQPGGASLWWLNESLAALESELGPILYAEGDSAKILPSIIKASGAADIYCNACYEPWNTALTQKIAADFEGLHIYNGNYLHDPAYLLKGNGSPYKIFTPFYNELKDRLEHMPDFEISAPPKKINLAPIPRGFSQRKPAKLKKWQTAWQNKLAAHWTPGEAGALERWHDFRDGNIVAYSGARDEMGEESRLSGLSPHLAWGEISPHRIWQEGRKIKTSAPFLRQICWREFSAYMLFHNPAMPGQPLRPEFKKFPWLKDRKALKAWQEGRTGYPLIDAGMRELWETGYMHNRVRMAAASFLIKHLMQPWQDGEAWFWDTLADADLGNNAANWQWVAGCGTDAAPYFRIFNPVLQGKKFDARGHYVRRWIPELKNVPDKFLHDPWNSPSPPANYPPPIVDHATARARALAAFKKIGKE